MVDNEDFQKEIHVQSIDNREDLVYTTMDDDIHGYWHETWSQIHAAYTPYDKINIVIALIPELQKQLSQI